MYCYSVLFPIDSKTYKIQFEKLRTVIARKERILRVGRHHVYLLEKVGSLDANHEYNFYGICVFRLFDG